MYVHGFAGFEGLVIYRCVLLTESRLYAGLGLMGTKRYRGLRPYLFGLVQRSPIGGGYELGS